MIFSLEKFHLYTYGRKVTVQSDHKPLENIVRKPLLSAPKRLQRMTMHIQKYDVDVVYLPGKDLVLADTLSRAYLPECSAYGSVEAEIETVNMLHHVPISTDSLSSIRSATKEDSTLQTLIETILQGWPNDKTKTSSNIRPYCSFQDELSYQDGIVFRGERVVKPEVQRRDITSQLHSSHLGVEGCLRRGSECVYWPGMNEQVKAYIAKWDICSGLQTTKRNTDLT